jgi:ribose transport system permease protein
MGKNFKSFDDKTGTLRDSLFIQQVTRFAQFCGTQTGGLLIIIIFFALFLSLRTPIFLTPANLSAVGVAMAGLVLASMGSTLVLLTGGFDLSIGSSYGLSGVVAALAMLSGIPVWQALLLGLLSGSLIGLINGIFVAKLDINAFIVTMGTMTIARGISNILTRGYSISGLPPSFTRLIYGEIFGIPPSIFFLLLSVVVTDLLLRFWRPARQLYYIGGSANYSRLIGIPISRVQIIAFILSGTLAALGGLLFTARTGAASQQAGFGLELMALLAPFLGGVGFGGKGSAFGAFLGATLIALVINSIQLLGVAVLWQDVLIGIFLIGAAIIGMTRLRRSEGKSIKYRLGKEAVKG